MPQIGNGNAVAAQQAMRMQQQQSGQLRQAAEEGGAEKKLAAAAEEAAAAAGKERRAQVRATLRMHALPLTHCTCQIMHLRHPVHSCLVGVQALHKYKQKRKNLNFTKKIRYESRKQLAQARPRVKGQFVRMTPGGPELTLDSDAQVLLPPIHSVMLLSPRSLPCCHAAIAQLSERTCGLDEDLRSQRGLDIQ